MGFTLLAGLEAVRDFAVRTPGQPAFLTPDGQVRNYHDLWSELLAVSARLRDAVIGEETTVAVLAPQGTMQVVAAMGVLAHCTCAPLQPRTTVAEVREALERLGAAALVVAPEFAAEAEAARTMGLVVLRVQEGVPAEAWQIDEPKVSRAFHPVAPPGTALLMSTSGTTGRARIVPLTQRDVNASVAARHRLLQLTAADRLLLVTSLAHLLGLQNTLAQWLAGGSVIASGGFDAERYGQWMRELQPTWYSCSPTVHQAALAWLEGAHLPQPSALRFVQSAGAPLAPEARTRLESLLGAPVWNDYGMTEASPIASDAFLPGGRVEGSAGRSWSLEIGIMHTSGRLLEAGENGEIVVRGPGVFSGYANDPEANGAAFHGDWFRTGDAGYLDDRGNLFISGRIKEMINRGGEKIAPSEVDSALAAHPAVLEAAAFPLPHPTLGEVVACVVVLRPGHPPVTAVELRRFVAGRLAAFKVPHRIQFIDRIPRGELGKPQRWQLAAEFSAPQSLNAINENHEFRQMPVEARDVFFKIREIWTRLLERDDLGIEESFFDAGGDSLAAMNMLAEVDEFFQCNASERAADFLDEPTLFRLTELVGLPPSLEQSPDPSNAMQVFAVRDNGLPVRIFCAPAEQDEGLYFRGLARHLSGLIDLFIVRRPRVAGRQCVHVFERDGADMAAAIRAAQPEGPYVVAGFCYGGVVAAEAARCLDAQHQEVRLVLFDVPLPGFPGLLHTAGVLAGTMLRRAASCEVPVQPHIPAPQKAEDALPLLLRRPAWTLISRTSRAMALVEHLRPIRWLMRHAQKGYFPFYRARALSMPVLHFLCEDEPVDLMREARQGWRRICRAGVKEDLVGFDHQNVFHEANLPLIVRTLCSWDPAAQPQAVDDALTTAERPGL